MKTQNEIISEFLENFINSDLQVEGRNEGECIFCCVELDRSQPHTSICPHTEATKLLWDIKQFTGKEKNHA